MNNSANQKLRVVFMGTPDFALTALRAIVMAGHDVVAVYSQPPRPKGRGQAVQKSPVHEFAEEKTIPVFHPLTLKTPEQQDEFAAHNADVAIVAAYGLILPQAVLDAPRFGCINIHASLLPRWRGASPIQQAVWHGDDKSGVTLMQMEAGLDTGPMIAARECPITQETTSASLHDTLAGMGGEMVVEILNTLATAQEKLPAVRQDDTLKTYASLLKKEDGQIDWRGQSATQIDCQVRALNPWPGVWSILNGAKIKILSVRIPDTQQDVPVDVLQGAKAGQILSRHGHILCVGGAAVQVLTLQPENKKPMDFVSALNGGYVRIGDVFE